MAAAIIRHYPQTLSGISDHRKISLFYILKKNGIKMIKCYPLQLVTSKTANKVKI